MTDKTELCYGSQKYCILKKVKDKPSNLAFRTIIQVQWTSQVTQWLRICLPMQEMWVWSLGQ